MNRILRTALVFTFVVGLSGIYVGKVLWASSCCGSDKDGGHSSHESGESETVKDPVCGMGVSDIKKAPSEEYKGKVYYFCSENCKNTFKKSPKSFVEGLLKK
ncbi:MAG TPA: YHS domain-containing protein [Candidatus Brocadiaceae bacterium]